MNPRFCIVLAAVVFSLSGCEYVDSVVSRLKRKPSTEGVVAVVGDHILYADELRPVTRTATSPQDSARLAEQFIKQWATELLLYDNARRQLGTQNDIEQLVDDYRRSLYVLQYEQLMLAQRMSTDISPDSLLYYYESQPDMLKLEENIVKGIFLVLPVTAPDRKQLLRWLDDAQNEIESIEHYAYQFASGYQVFFDEWYPLHKIMVKVPMEEDEALKQLKKHNLISFEDSTNIYMVYATDKRLVGEQMPYEYAESRIRKMLIEKRKTQFLRDFEETTYIKWKKSTGS